MLRNNDPTKPRVHGNEHINGQEDPIPGIPVLIFNDEADTAETVSSVAETTKYTYGLPINNYNKILIEAGTQARYEVDASNKNDLTWKIKFNGVLQKTFTERIIALATAGADSGNRSMGRITTIISGGQTSVLNITITGQQTINNAAAGFLLKYFRIWGINKKIRP